MTNLNELTDRILRAVTQDAYDTVDITRLVHRALQQQEALDQLAADNERLRKAVEIAGTHIQALEKQVESLEPFAHLQQYAEESGQTA